MPGIEEAAEELSKRRKHREILSQRLEGKKGIPVDSTVKEGFLSKEVENRSPPTVAGVDGGLVKKRYSAGDVVGSRAIAAVFSFGDKVKADYLPSKSPEPDFQVFDSTDNNSLDKNAEAVRLQKETEAAMKAFEKGAEMVLLDGSIVPSYLRDDEILDNFEELFEKGSDKFLAGVVEDSHGLKLSGILEDKLGVEIGDVRDTVLMDVVLDEGERSFVRRYSDSPVEHPILQKIGDKYVNRIHTFYVKLSSKDLPLRIDFYGDVEKADEIAGILQSLKSSERYTVPSPVVEADKRAKVPESYIKRLEKRFSPSLRRRDRRPF